MISISITTNRSGYWLRFCEAVARNDVELEVIFVGPVAALPKEELPVLTRFIDVPADFCPALCWEIGAREARGELLGLSCDDFVFSAGFLDAVAAELSKPHHEMDMVTARYVDNGKDSLHEQHMAGGEDMPLLPLAGFYTTESYHKLGGIDRRFVGALWDVDMYMHRYELGGRTFLLSEHECAEVDNSSHSLCERFKSKDELLLADLWPAPRHPSMKRALPRDSWPDWIYQPERKSP